MTDEILYRCKSCDNTYTVVEIGGHVNIVGECPNCGGHRFKSYVA